MHRPLTLWLLCTLITVTSLSSLATYQLSDKKQTEQTARALIMKPRSVLKGHRKQVGALAFSPDSGILAAGVEGGNAQLWDVATEKLQGVLTGHRTVARLAFSPDGQTLATVDVNVVLLWDVETKQLKTAPTRKKAFINSVAFTPDSRTVATASLEELIVRLWDVQTGRLEATLVHAKEDWAKGIGNVAFAPDGRTLATSSYCKAYLWDVATGQLRATLVDDNVVLFDGLKPRKGFSHGDTIYHLAISPEGRTVATASRDGTAKLWNAASGELRAILKGHKGRVARLAFSRDGRTLATGSDDKTAKLWDVEAGQLKATLKHRGTVWSMDFSPDGKLFATAADNDHSVKIWDAASGQLLNELKEARYPATFSPDGRTLATGGEKNSVLLWDVPPH